jgi:Na+-translocating ferredoxin:NAD+ oxidoreductase subunit B
MTHPAYHALAARLDAMPNGYPATESGVELRILERLFTAEEAELASQLRMALETPDEIAARLGLEPRPVMGALIGMAKRGLIKAARVPAGWGFGLLPFVVGIYEMQGPVLDAEFAQLFEEYYRQAYAPVMLATPSVHRVIPVDKAVRVDMEIHPYESASAIVDANQSWAVIDCICRKQKALIGNPCDHPVDVCLSLSITPGAFDKSSAMKALTKDEAHGVLRRSAEAGLVHTVSNNQEGLTYICNCCTCSCGILRGISEFKMANAVARSAFVNEVHAELCQGCGLCEDACQFEALEVEEKAIVNAFRCVGCGVCVLACPDGALALVRRPETDVLPTPVTEDDWRRERAVSRGIGMDAVR